MKRSTFVAVMVMAAAAVVVGCKRHGSGAAPAPARAAPTPKMKPMAVVDITKIIRAMGWSDEIQAAMYLADRQLQSDRDQKLKELYHQGMAMREQIVKEAKLNAAQAARVMNLQNAGQLDGLPLTEAQRQRLVASGMQITQRVEQVRRDYQRELAVRTRDVAGAYRDLILPAAKRVAAEDGFRTVIADTIVVIYHDPSTDVSQQVIDAMKRDKPGWEQAGGK